MQSAQMFMTGMYTPSQPIEGRAGIMDVHTMDGTYENMYPNAKYGTSIYCVLELITRDFY